MLAEQVITQRTVRVWFESHSIVSWLLLGLIAGWLAGKLARGRGFGCVTDIVLGLLGSYLGGWIFTKLGIFGGGFLYSLAAATLGAGHVVPAKAVMGSEDVGLFSLNGTIPAVMFRLGATDPATLADSLRSGKQLPGPHSPLFAPVYEPTIRTGVTALTAMALDVLR